MTLCVLMGFAQSLQLNGVDQYMSIPNSDALFPTAGGEYSVTLKVKVDDNQSNARFVSTRGYAGTDNNATCGYELYGGNNNIQFFSVNTSLDGKPWGNSNVYVSATGGMGRFVHLSWVFDGAAKTSTLYVDGVKADTKTVNEFATLGWGNNGLDALVGAGYSNNNGHAVEVSSFTKGEIDDVHFYNKALTADEVVADKDNFSLMTATNLVAAYDFDFVSGNTVPDVSNNGHNGTLHGYKAATFTVTKAAASAEGYVKVMNGGNMIWGGEEVEAGTVLTLEAIVTDEAYELDYFTANGEQIEGNTYTVNADVELGVVFKAKAVEPEPQPEEPTYAVPAPEANTRANSTARLVNSITVTGATVDGAPVAFTSDINNSQYWWENAQTEVYKDMTAETLAVTAGDRLHFDIKHNIEWMHFYVYIDYNHDGEFDVNNELVSYSYLNGQDSEGNAVQGSSLRLPDFTVKADAQAVKTRMRIKVDWDSNDPTGNKDPNNTIGKNNGAIYDYTIDIHAGAAVAQKYVVNVDEYIEGGEVTMTDAEGHVIAPGSEVEEGTVITLSNTPEDVAYVLDSYLVNDEPIEGNTFTVTGETTVSAEFAIKQFTLHIVQPAEGGTLSVQKSNFFTGETVELVDGAKIQYYDQVMVVAEAAEKFDFKHFLLNGEVTEIPEGILLITEDVAVEGAVTVSAAFEAQPEVEPEYAIPTGDQNKRGTLDTRILNSVTILGGTLDGEAQEFTSVVDEPNYPREVYVDKTDEVVHMTAGNEIKVNMNHTIIWMHAYVYIDYDHDGVFNEDNELVAYSYLDGKNSAGESLSSGPNTLEIPPFIVEDLAKDVNTRMRLKIDWDSSDPLGNPDGSIGRNSGTMIDFTVNLHKKPAPKEFTLNFDEEVANGYWMLYETETNRILSNGDKVLEGTEITVDAAPATGYITQQVLVNGKRAVKRGAYYRFVMEADTRVEVVFSDKFLVEYNAEPANGKVSVTTGDDFEVISGGEVYVGETINVHLIPQPGYEVESIFVNGEDQTANIKSEEGQYGQKVWSQKDVSYNLEIDVKFREALPIHTLNVESTQGGSVMMENKATLDFLFPGDKVANETPILVTIMPSTGYKLVSFEVNGEEMFADVKKGEYSLTYEMVVTSDVTFNVTFQEDPTTGIGEVSLESAGYDATTGMISVPAGATAQVYNAAGQLVQNVAGATEVSASGWASGAYVLRVASAQGVKVVKFIKK